MFEEISPGYYEKNYGHLLSGAMHRGIASLIFRVDGQTNKDMSIKMGSVWDERMGTFIVNNFMALSYFYLINFPKFFQEGFSKLDGDLLIQYTEIIDWLKAGMEDHKKTHVRSQGWYKEMEGFST